MMSRLLTTTRSRPRWSRYLLQLLFVTTATRQNQDSLARGSTLRGGERFRQDEDPPVAAAAAVADDESASIAIATVADDERPPAAVEGPDHLDVRIQILNGDTVAARIANGGGGATVGDVENDAAFAEFLATHAPGGSHVFFVEGEDSSLGGEALLADCCSVNETGERVLFLLPGVQTLHLSRGDIGELSEDDIRILGRSQIGRLTEDQVAGLTRAQCGWLSMNQVRGFTREPNGLVYEYGCATAWLRITFLSGAQISALSTDNLQWLATSNDPRTDSTRVKLRLTREQIAGLSRLALGHLLPKLDARSTSWLSGVEH